MGTLGKHKREVSSPHAVSGVLPGRENKSGSIKVTWMTWALVSLFAVSIYQYVETPTLTMLFLTVGLAAISILECVRHGYL